MKLAKRKWWQATPEPPKPPKPPLPEVSTRPGTWVVLDYRSNRIIRSAYILTPEEFGELAPFGWEEGVGVLLAIHEWWEVGRPLSRRTSYAQMATDDFRCMAKAWRGQLPLMDVFYRELRKRLDARAKP